MSYDDTRREKVAGAHAQIISHYAHTSSGARPNDTEIITANTYAVIVMLLDADTDPDPVIDAIASVAQNIAALVEMHNTTAERVEAAMARRTPGQLVALDLTELVVDSATVNLTGTLLERVQAGSSLAIMRAAMIAAAALARPEITTDPNRNLT